jgi:acyl-coenzyme A thioesterase PaaI-like protein
MSSAPATPLDAAHDGWTLLPRRESHEGDGKFAVSFVAQNEGDGLRCVHFMRDDDGALVGRAWFGPRCEGPPGHAHGGAIASVLDDVMGNGAWLAGHRVVAATIEVEFKKPVPLETIATFETHVDKVEGKRVHMSARVLFGDGSVLALGRGVFVVVDLAQKLRVEGG